MCAVSQVTIYMLRVFQLFDKFYLKDAT